MKDKKSHLVFSADNLKLAQLAKAAKIQAWKNNSHLLTQKFSDLPYWRKLASKFGVRLPSAYIPGIDGLRQIRRAMRVSGVTPDKIKDVFGFDVKKLALSNPKWPAYALVGLILEIADECEKARECITYTKIIENRS